MRTIQTIFLGVVVLVAMAGQALSQDKLPQSTRPQLTTTNETQTAAPAKSVKAADEFPVIGYLEKRDRTITIKAGPKGPLYSVKTADGKVLGENLSADQLRAQAPELSEFFKTAVAGAAGANKADARLRVTMDASLERTTRR
jgi:hypothetical protein